MSNSLHFIAKSSADSSVVLGVWDGTRAQQHSLTLDLSSYNTAAVTDSNLICVSEGFSKNVIVYGHSLMSKLASINLDSLFCLVILSIIHFVWLKLDGGGFGG